MITNKNFTTRIKKTLLALTVSTMVMGMALVPSQAVRAEETKQSTEEAASTETAFDATYYASQYPDVVAIFGNDPQTLYWHYVNYGKAEGRYANAQDAANALAQANQSTNPATEQTEQPGATPDATAKAPQVIDDGVYNILAIGNSITLHPVCGYWWGSWGMAASSMDKDYVHQVQVGLAQKYQNTSLDIISVQSWETSSARNRQLSKFDSKLANQYDLVIIQLGENVNNMTTFKKDFNKLVSYVKTAQPNARVVVVGDYWYRSGRDAAKKDVAAKQGCGYADISAIRGKAAYRAASGSKVLGDDGKYHTVKNQAVLKHPNDAGMKYIADRILEVL
ncbi:GDSL-like Lipase/Acylhydrolase family protein [Pseudobutyrivibrio sp. YE44]|uniref:SGNH/GDSL hydrolase family protein n=1 Tax=Pseudobutyrivibrio sp. YE44 TaxID=1520802 RepID=UPI00087F0394|nr:SGNH/GDSL hydrolase family protein [Pseudobutyrivibrio sp. YE44]SDB11961.1 GDSL-like Lipase/Acylhydrolase family protein [Pseudobutyrivibrio sp. YE44]